MRDKLFQVRHFGGGQGDLLRWSRTAFQAERTAAQRPCGLWLGLFKKQGGGGEDELEAVGRGQLTWALTPG